MSDGHAAAGDCGMRWFWKNVGADVANALTAEQRTAIEEGVRKSSASARPADIKLHLGKYFVRITAGKERRNKERLKQDLIENPIFTKKNAPLIAVLWGLSLLASLYILAFMVNAFERFVIG